MLPIVLLFLYCSASLWLSASLHVQSGALSAHGKRLIGVILCAVAWLGHGYLLCETLFRTGELGLSISLAASLIGWVIAALAMLALLQSPRFAAISSFLLVCVGLAAANQALWGNGLIAERNSWQLTAHIILAVVAYSLIAVGAVLALALIWLDRRLHRHVALQTVSKLPSVEALETGMFQAITVGFLLLTLTLLSGLIFVEDLLAQHLIHKTVLSFLSWLALAVLLFGRWRFGWRGQLAARWAVSGFTVLGLAYFGSKFVLEALLGKHWG